MFSLFVLFLTSWNFGLKFPTRRADQGEGDREREKGTIMRDGVRRREREMGWRWWLGEREREREKEKGKREGFVTRE